MKTPFSQGSLDNFCALYAVINALRSLHNLSSFQCRRILHETLLRYSKDYDFFSGVVTGSMDYEHVVHEMLSHYCAELFPVRAYLPFKKAPASEDALWDAVARWLTGVSRRAVLLRFMRFTPQQDAAVIRHWTVAERLLGDSMFLYDSSREPTALHSLMRHQVTSFRENVTEERFVWVLPQSCIFLEGADMPAKGGFVINHYDL
ncbi:hypothetical protein [Oleidesulfovibrio sp.]|uniref:hypothetical protein n=1 Tax=Oleidesulfovibrio sp. TaxID=2909707 RepID=UPI003A8A197B